MFHLFFCPQIHHHMIAAVGLAQRPAGGGAQIEGEEGVVMVSVLIWVWPDAGDTVERNYPVRRARVYT